MPAVPEDWYYRICLWCDQPFIPNPNSRRYQKYCCYNHGVMYMKKLRRQGLNHRPEYGVCVICRKPFAIHKYGTIPDCCSSTCVTRKWRRKKAGLL